MLLAGADSWRDATDLPQSQAIVLGRVSCTFLLDNETE
jgi:hypothetical protein